MYPTLSSRHGRLLETLLTSVALVAFAPGAGAQILPTALPMGGAVAAGNATISQSGATLTVKENTPSAILNWQGFNVGSRSTVDFQQPNASAVILNRVIGGGVAQIEGKVNANGQVFVVDPAGVVFGKGARSTPAHSSPRRSISATRSSWRGSTALPAARRRAGSSTRARSRVRSAGTWRCSRPGLSMRA